MRCSSIPLPVGSSVRRARRGGWIGFRFARWLGLLAAGSVLAARAGAQEAPTASGKDEFASLVKLAPFVVSGKSLAISIYARSRSDRRYGEEFSEGVAKVIYEAVTEQTGKGLVIIGAKGEPHPTLVFRKFLTLANEGKLDPAVAAHGPELSAMLEQWQQMLNDGQSAKADGAAASDATEGEELDLDFEKIFVALPLPLQGIGAKLYQLAWEEKFDEAKVEAKLRALRAGDLERRDRFKSFDWVFYLPPKGAFDRALDDVIAAALKKEELGFFARTAVKGVLLVLKPKIRRAIEGMRRGMMFTTVVRAQTSHSKEDVSALADAYVEVFMPFVEKEKRPPGRNDHERAVSAVREQLRKNAEPRTPAESAAAKAAANESAAVAPAN